MTFSSPLYLSTLKHQSLSSFERTAAQIMGRINTTWPHDLARDNIQTALVVQCLCLTISYLSTSTHIQRRSRYTRLAAHQLSLFGCNDVIADRNVTIQKYNLRHPQITVCRDDRYPAAYWFTYRYDRVAAPQREERQTCCLMMSTADKESQSCLPSIMNLIYAFHD
jgi:hypothetical protein